MSERCGIHAYRYVWATYLTFSVTSVETFWNMPAGNWIPPVCPAFKPCYILTGRNCWLGVASKKGRATKCLEKLFSRKVVIWQKVEAVASVTNSCLLRATGVSFYGSLSVEVHLRWCTDAVIFKSEWRNFDNYEVQQRTVQTSWRSFDEVPHPFRVLALFFVISIITRYSSARYKPAGGLLMKFHTHFEFWHFSSACSRNFQVLICLQSQQERHVPSEMHLWPRHRVAHPRCVVTEHLSQRVAVWIGRWGAHGRCVCGRPNKKWLPLLGINGPRPVCKRTLLNELSHCVGYGRVSQSLSSLEAQTFELWGGLQSRSALCRRGKSLPISAIEPRYLVRLSRR